MLTPPSALALSCCSVAWIFVFVWDCPCWVCVCGDEEEEGRGAASGVLDAAFVVEGGFRGIVFAFFGCWVV